MSRGHALVALLFVLGSAAAQYSSVATLFSSSNCLGAFVVVSGKTPNLAQLGFDNRAYSAGLRGPWMFFDLENYNTRAEAPAEYAYESTEHCVNLFNVGVTTSIKYAGHQANYRQDSMTFYEFTYFQGREEFANGDIPYFLELGSRISSFIVTGTSSWTIYSGTYYSGDALCLEIVYTPNVDPAFVPDTALLNPSIPHNTISSVRKGCYTRNAVSVIGGTNATIHQNKVQRNTSFNL